MADNLKNLLKALATEADLIDLEASKISTALRLDTANGYWLDVVGFIAGAPKRYVADGRYNIADAEYRSLIEDTIQGFIAPPSRETIINAVITIVPGTTFVQVLEFAGVILIAIDTPITQDQLQRVKEVVAAGVGLFIVQDFPPSFAFDGNNAELLGFGDSAEIVDFEDVFTAPTGGRYSGLIGVK